VLAGALRQARPHGTALQVKDCDAVSGTHKLDIRGNPVPADVWGAKTVSCALTCSVLGSVAVCRLLPREVPALRRRDPKPKPGWPASRAASAALAIGGMCIAGENDAVCAFRAGTGSAQRAGCPIPGTPAGSHP